MQASQHIAERTKANFRTFRKCGLAHAVMPGVVWLLAMSEVGSPLHVCCLPSWRYGSGLAHQRNSLEQREQRRRKDWTDLQRGVGTSGVVDKQRNSHRLLPVHLTKPRVVAAGGKSKQYTDRRYSGPKFSYRKHLSEYVDKAKQ